VDAGEEEGGVPSRLIKTDAGDGRQERTPIGEYVAFAGARRGWQAAGVRNGKVKERKLTVGSERLPIRAPRVNDKRVDEETGERKRFSSVIVPAYARRSPKVTEVIPILYLHGLSTGDFGARAQGSARRGRVRLSSSSVQRLTESWQAEHAAFRTRELPVSPLRVPVRRRGECQCPARRGSQALPAGHDRRSRGR
jgi:hypothetical protein